MDGQTDNVIAAEAHSDTTEKNHINAVVQTNFEGGPGVEMHGRSASSCFEMELVRIGYTDHENGF